MPTQPSLSQILGISIPGVPQNTRPQGADNGPVPNPLSTMLFDPNFTVEDFVTRNLNRINERTQSRGKLSQAAGDLGFSVFNQLGEFGTDLTALGFGSLFDILRNQGRTDPAMMNRVLTGIGRDTAANQDALAGNLAQRGLERSGVGAALNAALGQSGVNKAADIRAQDAYLAEQRRRGDLQLLYDLVFGPATDAAALAMGQAATNRQLSTQRSGDILGLIGGGLGGLLSNENLFKPKGGGG